jgi:hypothetical protein
MTQFDPGNRIELWLCDDCVLLHETGELDSEDIDDIAHALGRLEEQGSLTSDDIEDCESEETERRGSGRLEFSWRDCDCCGSDLGGSRSRYALFPKLDEE